MIRNAYGVARAWLKCTQHFQTKSPSLRELFGCRKGQPTVIAIGGNSFKGLESATAENIIRILDSGRVPIITHGNGPQVGELLAKYPEKTIAECVHITQVEMGRQMKGELERLGVKMDVRVIPTRVLVAHDDPAFDNPTKYIGPRYSFKQLAKGELGKTRKMHEAGKYKVVRPNGKEWVIKKVEGEEEHYRRVVASPKPLAIFPQDFIKIIENLNAGKLVIAVGGGGVAMCNEPMDGGVVQYVAEAVIDKDLASALLARDLRAREMIISTGVREVALNWGKTEQVDLGYMQTKQALKQLKRDQFPAGSMGEKMEAAINALRFGVNTVLITSPESSWVNDEGTLLTRGIDLTGRFKNLVRNKPYELQRWMLTKEEPKSSAAASVLSRHSRSGPFQR